MASEINVPVYELDLTDSNPNNLITERHTLTDINLNEFNILIPRRAPFYHKDVSIIKLDTGEQLVYGKDYYFGGLFKGFTGCTKDNLPVSGVIVFSDLTVSGEYQITYRTLGGDYVLDEQEFAQIFRNFLNNPFYVTWEEIVNKPIVYPPEYHGHHATELDDYTDMVNELRRLVEALSDWAKRDDSDKPSYQQLITAIINQGTVLQALDQKIDDLSNAATNRSIIRINDALKRIQALKDETSQQANTLRNNAERLVNELRESLAHFTPADFEVLKAHYAQNETDFAQNRREHAEFNRKIGDLTNKVNTDVRNALNQANNQIDETRTDLTEKINRLRNQLGSLDYLTATTARISDYVHTPTVITNKIEPINNNLTIDIGRDKIFNVTKTVNNQPKNVLQVTNSSVSVPPHLVIGEKDNNSKTTLLYNGPNNALRGITMTTAGSVNNHAKLKLQVTDGNQNPSNIADSMVDVLATDFIASDGSTLKGKVNRSGDTMAGHLKQVTFAGTQPGWDGGYSGFYSWGYDEKQSTHSRHMLNGKYLPRLEIHIGRGYGQGSKVADTVPNSGGFGFIDLNENMKPVYTRWNSSGAYMGYTRLLDETDLVRINQNLARAGDSTAIMTIVNNNKASQDTKNTNYDREIAALKTADTNNTKTLNDRITSEKNALNSTITTNNNNQNAKNAQQDRDIAALRTLVNNNKSSIEGTLNNKARDLTNSINSNKAATDTAIAQLRTAINNNHTDSINKINAAKNEAIGKANEAKNRAEAINTALTNRINQLSSSNGNYVHKTNDEVVGGVKTFTTRVRVKKGNANTYACFGYDSSGILVYFEGISGNPHVRLNEHGYLELHNSNGLYIYSGSSRAHVEASVNGAVLRDPSTDRYIEVGKHVNRLYMNMPVVCINGLSLTNENGYLKVPDFMYTSDRAYKTNIKPIKNALSTILKLQGQEYDLTKDSKRHATGFIAQEVQEVLPHVVNGEEGNLGVHYQDIIPYLVEAMKELKQEIDILKVENTSLREELSKWQK